MAQLTQLADGRYRLAGALGAGAMGTVYRGWDQRAGAWRAIKLLSPIFARDRTMRARFRREPRALRRMAHPNIVAVHDFSEDGSSEVVIRPARDSTQPS